MSEVKRSSGWVTAALAAVLVLLFSISLYFGSQTVSSGEEAFTGADSIAVEAAEAAGAEAWFDPVFEPGSGEVEAGLFALQAAIGGGVLGFALGRLGRRESSGEEANPPAGPADKTA